MINLMLGIIYILKIHLKNPKKLLISHPQIS